MCDRSEVEQFGCREVDTAHDGRISNRADELKIGLEELVSLEQSPPRNIHTCSEQHVSVKKATRISLAKLW